MNLLYLLLAAIPLHLPVDISRPASPALPVYHGETLEIEAELKDRGTAFNVALTNPQLYYQTPGMGNNWWTLPATQTNNLLRATFPASADPGEDRLVCFLGSAGENFRAAFILNFRHSPGATPNQLELPVPTLDFSQITILNSPYETIEAAASAHTNLSSQISAVQGDVQAVSNALVAAEADLSAQIAAATPADYNTVKEQVAANTASISTNTADIASLQSSAAAFATQISNEFARVDHTHNTYKTKQSSKSSPAASTTEAYQFIDTISQAANGEITATKKTMRKATTSAPGMVQLNNNLDSTRTDHAATADAVRRVNEAVATKADASQVTTIINYLEGNDARVIITNYDSQVEMPTLSFEQKNKNDNTWRTIWNERTRWDEEAAYRASTSNSVASLAARIDTKADRAWGFYDSHTGNYAPDGFTWLSSPKIAIAAGLAYERHVTTDGAIWLLESNGLVTEASGATNGFFRVSDDEGNAIFEIVKGERRTVGASANRVAVTNGTLYAHYSVVSVSHPVIYACTNLTTLAAFIDESGQSCPCTVSWSGSSGDWTAAITPKGATPNVFAKAEYVVGGETYIRNAAPTSMDYIILGGTKYQLGTATISGSTVLTLTEAP